MKVAWCGGRAYHCKWQKFSELFCQKATVANQVADLLIGDASSLPE